MANSESERAGLEMMEAFLATGPTLREVKKFVKDELAALDAEKISDYDDEWDDSWTPPYMNQ